MPNRMIPIQPNSDPMQQLAVINRNFAELDTESVKKLYDDPNGIHRIFIDATTGIIKTSKPGIDVTSATPAGLSFNSAQNNIKVVDEVTVTISPFSVTSSAPSRFDRNANSNFATHTLGFKPSVIISELEPSGSDYGVPYSNTFIGTSGQGGWSAATYVVDESKVTVAVQLMVCSTASAGLTINYLGGTFHCYLLQETAA